MPKKRPFVVVTRRLPSVVETRLRELFDAKLNSDDAPMPREALAEAMASADVLVLQEDDERFNLAVGRTRDGQYLILESASHITTEARVLRADEPLSSLERSEVLAEAPAVESGRFKVPRILGEAP